MDSSKMQPRSFANKLKMICIFFIIFSHFIYDIPAKAEENTSKLIPVYQLLMLNEDKQTVQPSNNRPLANAGADQQVIV